MSDIELATKREVVKLCEENGTVIPFEQIAKQFNIEKEDVQAILMDHRLGLI